MNAARYSPSLIIGMILALCFGISLFLRTYFPYENIFSGEWIKFGNVDVYYHMRLVDNMLQHFPQRIAFDPYTAYPRGHIIFWPPLFDWLIAGIAWIIGFGAPSQHTVDMVGAYLPAIAGAMTTIAIFFTGRALFNNWVGLLSAGLIALIPGLIEVSAIGAADHHIGETLFSTLTILFLVLAIKSAKERELTFHNLFNRNIDTVTRPGVYTLLAGISVAAYLLTSAVGLLFIFLFFIYFMVQFVIDNYRGENTDYLVFAGMSSILIASVISLPLLPRASWLSHLYLPSLMIALFTLPVLAVISRLRFIRRKRGYFPLAIVGVGIVCLALLYVINSALVSNMLGMFNMFNPGPVSPLMTIAETQPLLYPLGQFSFSVTWSYFTTGFFLSIVALSIIAFTSFKQNSADKNLLVVWSLLILVATLGQRRFSHYFVVNTALLTGFIAWQILAFTGVKKIFARPVDTLKKPKKKGGGRPKEQRSDILQTRITAAIGIVMVILLIFLPNIGETISIAGQPRNAPTDAWYRALTWLNENSPEPFGEPDYYYQLYEPPETMNGNSYQESAYSVISWADNGHWITRIAHRIPVANPFHEGITEVSEILTARDEASANELADTLDSRYIIIDYATIPLIPGMAELITGKPDLLREIYYQRVGKRLLPTVIFYPAYYQSLAVRLYIFDAGQVEAGNPMVVSYTEEKSTKGMSYKLITDLQSFSSPNEATEYISRQKDGNCRLVSDDPFISPVALEALEGYKLIYQSEHFVFRSDVTDIGDTKMTLPLLEELIPSIKIFEFIK
ncbi:oligosaccharyl transferase, archaeosortase A system-associated [Chloroflexota bacterium]